MDWEDIASVLRNILFLSAFLSLFFVVLSIDSIKYYAVLYQVPQGKLVASFERFPKLIRWFYLRNLNEIYLEKYSREQNLRTFNIRCYFDSAIPFAFFVATPIGLSRAINEGTPSVLMYIFFLVALPLTGFWVWSIGKCLLPNAPE